MRKNNILDKIGLVSFGLLATMPVVTFLFKQEPSVLPVDQIEKVEELKVELNEDANSVEISEADKPTVKLLGELNERLANQEKVDVQIQTEVESGYYSPEQPLVILDPYSQSPLTALICFSTEVPTRVTIHLEGKDEYTEVNHSFLELTTQHVIPVYGLYPDALNLVTLTVFDEHGEEVSGAVVEIFTEYLPDDFENLIILTTIFEDGYQEGLNFLYNNKLSFDIHGDIRHFFSDRLIGSSMELHYPENKFIVFKGAYHSGSTFFFEIDRLGKVYSVYYSPYGCHHDISPMGNGNILVTGSNPIGETIEDFVYEINSTTGEIENSLDFKYVLQRTRPVFWDDFIDTADWLHMNSLEYDESDNTILISSNCQAAVAKLDWPSGEIHWILASDKNWNPRLEKYILAPIGLDFEYPYGQHAAIILPDYDNNPDTIDILLFDNGTNRFMVPEELAKYEGEAIPELYSRTVHYRINEVTMEVQQIWQYGKERGLDLYSVTCGDSDLLKNGNILSMFKNDFVYGVGYPVLNEVTQESELIWEAEIFTNTTKANANEYRAERLPFYFDDDAEHDIYAVARNLIPIDIMSMVDIP